MAARYWTGAVNGGTGTWTNSSTTNWSTTSGGAGGASVPGLNDVAFFDANSGTGVCALGENVSPGSINLTGYAGTLDFSTFKISVINTGSTIVNLGSTVTLTGLKRIDVAANASSGTRTLAGLLTSSPGGPEANAPDVYVTAGTDTIGGGINCKNLDFTGFSGALNGASQFIYGDLIMSPTMTTNSGTSPILFSSTSVTPRTITSNGITFNFPLRFNGAGGSWLPADNLVLSSARPLQLYNGTFDANNKNITVGGFAMQTGTKTLKMGAGTWTVTGDNATINPVWDGQFAVAGFTVNPGTAIINMTSANAKTFAGGGKIWPTLNQGGAGTLTIQQSNTFANITNTVQPATITLTSGTTQTVTQFTASGTSGNLITLNASTPGSRATITDSGNVNSVSYMSIKDIVATGYGEWQAYTSNGNVDGGNNVGWVFAAPPPLTASEYQISLKSFTERRSF